MFLDFIYTEYIFPTGSQPSFLAACYQYVSWSSQYLLLYIIKHLFITPLVATEGQSAIIRGSLLDIYPAFIFI